MPVLATAAGKAIAASLSSEELERLLRELDFEGHASRTITSPRRFATELRRIRKEGYSVALDEYHEGLYSAAVSLDARLFGRPSALVAVLPSMMAPIKDPTELCLRSRPPARPWTRSRRRASDGLRARNRVELRR